MEYEFDEFSEEFNSPQKVEQGTKIVDEKLWEKLSIAGSKIRFAKDVKALYRYLKDGSIAWYRKSIIVAALIYFISPIDAIPDIAPLIGYLDDLGVIAAVIKFMGNEIVPYYD